MIIAAPEADVDVQVYAEDLPMRIFRTSLIRMLPGLQYAHQPRIASSVSKDLRGGMSVFRKGIGVQNQIPPEMYLHYWYFSQLAFFS